MSYRHFMPPVSSTETQKKQDEMAVGCFLRAMDPGSPSSLEELVQAGSVVIRLWAGEGQARWTALENLVAVVTKLRLVANSSDDDVDRMFELARERGVYQDLLDQLRQLLDDVERYQAYESWKAQRGTHGHQP
jgi:hypothetical protein